jgi:hypothetical protein
MAILGILGAALVAGGIVTNRRSTKVSARASGAAAVAAGVVMWAIILLTTPFTTTSGDAPPPTSDFEGLKFEVTVRFNTSVTQDDIDEAGVLLRTFDDDVEFLIMEMFPPVGRAVVAVDTPGFCQAVAADLEARSYVNDVSCRSWAGGGEGEPDAPVSTYAP